MAVRILAPILLIVLAVGVRVGGLDRPPSFDELYHLLAGAGWLETGTFSIADGIYDRASAYTLMVAALLEAGDNSVEIVRLSSLVFGTGLVLALFLWTWSVAGPVAAWTAGLAAIFWPESIGVSQTIRFYAPAGLLFFLAAIAVFVALDRPMALWARVLLCGLAAAAILFGMHFTPVVLVGLSGILLWAGLFVILPLLLARPGGVWIVVGLVVLGLLALAGLWASGTLAGFWTNFRWAPDWVAQYRNDLSYYHRMFREAYGVFWPLTPLAVILAVAWRPRPALFAVSVFLVPLFFHSLAGMKEGRYVYHLMPFLFAIWGIAAASVAAAVSEAMVGRGTAALGAVHPRLAMRPLAVLLGVVALLFAAYSNAAVPAALKLARGGFWPDDAADWRIAAPAILPHLEDADVVVSSRELQAIWYLDRIDVVANASRFSELRGADEFAEDPRTGLPIVSADEAMAQLMSCTADGIFISPVEVQGEADAILADESAVPAGTTLRPLDVPQASGIEAMIWETADPGGPDCGPVRAAVSEAE